MNPSDRYFRISRGNLLRLIVAVLALCLTTPALAGKMPSDNDRVPTVSMLASSQCQERVKDGGEFLKEMAEAANALRSYSFCSHMVVNKGDKTIEENSKFCFKKPRRIRAEELGPFKKGSVAILLPNGKVRGHMGGMMSRFVGTVDANSDWVTSANGYPLSDSDFYGMSQVMLGFLKEGKKTLVTDAPVTVAGHPNPVYVLEMYANAARTELMKRAYIDPQTLLPVEWFDYKNSKLFAHTTWKELQIDVEISDAVFTM